MIKLLQIRGYSRLFDNHVKDNMSIWIVLINTHLLNTSVFKHFLLCFEPLLLLHNLTHRLRIQVKFLSFVQNLFIFSFSIFFQLNLLLLSKPFLRIEVISRGRRSFGDPGLRIHKQLFDNSFYLRLNRGPPILKLHQSFLFLKKPQSLNFPTLKNLLELFFHPIIHDISLTFHKLPSNLLFFLPFNLLNLLLIRVNSFQLYILKLFYLLKFIFPQRKVQSIFFGRRRRFRRSVTVL